MAAMMASTLAGSRPSEKLGTHSTSVDISGKDSWRWSREAREGSCLGHYPSGPAILPGLAQAAGSDSLHPQATPMSKISDLALTFTWQSAFPPETGQII